MTVIPAGWHPDPGGPPSRLRWWDGQAWTDHVHESAAAPAAPASPLDAPVLMVASPQVVTPGTRVFELTDASGGRLGRLVETTRGLNDSALGARLSRSKGWQHATTREVRGPRGYAELVLTWGPATPGTIAVSRPDRREVGRLVAGTAGWAVLGPDGHPWGRATPDGMTEPGGGRLSVTTTDGAGGWRTILVGDPPTEPRRSLAGAAALTADLLTNG